MDSNNKQTQATQNQEYSNISYVVAGLILTGFFIFITGYYWGKQVIISQLSEQTKQNYLSDKIENSVYNITNEAPEESSSQVIISEENRVENPDELCYAKLAGFGSLSMAKATLAKIQKAGVESSLVTKKSRTSKGRTITWYQIETNVMPRKDLEDQIKKLRYIINTSQVTIIKK